MESEVGGLPVELLGQYFYRSVVCLYISFWAESVVDLGRPAQGMIFLRVGVRDCHSPFQQTQLRNFGGVTKTTKRFCRTNRTQYCTMKLFNWGSSGDASVRSSTHAKTAVEKQKIMTTSKRSNDEEDAVTESPVTSTASPSDKEESKPVDMDQYCNHNTDDEADDDASIRTIEDEVEDLPCVRNEEPQYYSSALTKTMNAKQTKITKTMEKIFEDVFQTVGDQQESKKQFEERAATNLKKQEHITKQFVDLIQRLEQEAMMKEDANQRLRKSLRKANQLLESEGVSMVGSQPTMTLSTRRHHRFMRPETFSITEIFCNNPKEEDEMDDMTCQLNDETPHSKEAPLTPVTTKTSESLPLSGSEQELLEL